MSPLALTPKSDHPFTLRSGMHSTRNPSPHYISLSYHRLSLPFYTCLSFLSSVTIPKVVHEALAHPSWRQAMTDELSALHNSGIGNWSRYHLGNLLLVAGGCLLLKLDLMVLLIASKLSCDQRLYLNFWVGLWRYLFSRGKDGFYSFIYRHGCSSTMASLSTGC